jgi:hypothetical protein
MARFLCLCLCLCRQQRRLWEETMMMISVNL